MGQSTSVSVAASGPRGEEVTLQRGSKSASWSSTAKAGRARRISRPQVWSASVGTTCTSNTRASKSTPSARTAAAGSTWAGASHHVLLGRCGRRSVPRRRSASSTGSTSASCFARASSTSESSSVPSARCSSAHVRASSFTHRACSSVCTALAGFAATSDGDTASSSAYNRSEAPETHRRIAPP
eukprot:3255251-Rhodomonas_salina.1